MSTLDQVGMARLAMNPTPTGIGMMAAGKILGGMFGGNRPPMPTYTEGKGWRYGNSAVQPEFVGNVVNYLRGGLAPRQNVLQQQNRNITQPQGSPIIDNMRNQQQDYNYVKAMRMNKYATDNNLQNPGFQVQPPRGSKPAYPKTSAMKPPTV